MLRAAATVALAAVCAALSPPSSGAPNVWAVVVSSSRYWFNYRHSANAMAVYGVRELFENGCASRGAYGHQLPRSKPLTSRHPYPPSFRPTAVRRLGVPDDRIVLMLADEHAVGAKNPFGGALFGGDQDRSAGGNLHPPDAVVDYAGPDVTPEALFALLTGRHAPGTPRARMLAAGSGGPRDRLLLYMTGHGGDGFLKFHDKTEMAAEDLADALHAGRVAGRFGDVLALFDTCQAATLTEPLRRLVTGGSNGTGSTFVALASSVRDENSYATGHDTGACGDGGMWARPCAWCPSSNTLTPWTPLICSHRHRPPADLGQSLMDGFTKTLTGFLHGGVDALGLRIHDELARLAGDSNSEDGRATRGDAELKGATVVAADGAGSGRGAYHASPLRRVGAFAGLCDALRQDDDGHAAAEDDRSGAVARRRLQLKRACAQLRRHTSGGDAAPAPPTTTHLAPLSCGTLAAFPSFAAAARRHEAALRRGRPASLAAPDGAAGCVLAAMDVVTRARRRPYGGAAADDAALLLASALGPLLSPHLPPPGGTTAAGADPPQQPLRERLTAGGFFRHAAKWRTHSTTYAAVVEHDIGALFTGTTGSNSAAGGDTGDSSCHGHSLPPLVYDGSKSWEPGQWGAPPSPPEAAALAVLDGLSLLGFLANAGGADDVR